MSTTQTVYIATMGIADRTEVVRPLRTRGNNTLIGYIRGARVASKWIRTDRITNRDTGEVYAPEEVARV